MRSVKAGLFSGALWGTLWLLGGCVADEPPVDGSKPLASLSGPEFVALCDWAMDYMGGQDYKHPESTEDEHTAVHICPPTDEDLGLPDDNPLRYTRWSDEACVGHGGALAGLGAIVDDFARLIYTISDRPCVDFALALSTGGYYFVEYTEEMN